VLQHINARQDKNIQDDREFQALSKSTTAFLKIVSHRDNNFKKKATKVSKKRRFLVLVN